MGNTLFFMSLCELWRNGRFPSQKVAACGSLAIAAPRPPQTKRHGDEHRHHRGLLDTRAPSVSTVTVTGQSVQSAEHPYCYGRNWYYAPILCHVCARNLARGPYDPHACIIPSMFWLQYSSYMYPYHRRKS